MHQNEIIYDINTAHFVVILLCLIMAAYELFFRLGRFLQNRSSSELKALTNAIQTGILGLLALLLGFTFNMSLQRFDN